MLLQPSTVGSYVHELSAQHRMDSPRSNLTSPYALILELAWPLATFSSALQAETLVTQRPGLAKSELRECKLQTLRASRVEINLSARRELDGSAHACQPPPLDSRHGRSRVHDATARRGKGECRVFGQILVWPQGKSFKHLRGDALASAVQPSSPDSNDMHDAKPSTMAAAVQQHSSATVTATVRLVEAS